MIGKCALDCMWETIKEEGLIRHQTVRCPHCLDTHPAFLHVISRRNFPGKWAVEQTDKYQCRSCKRSYAILWVWNSTRSFYDPVRYEEV
jgi:transposase-like protein